MQSSRFIEPH